MTAEKARINYRMVCLLVCAVIGAAGAALYVGESWNAFWINVQIAKHLPSPSPLGIKLVALLKDKAVMVTVAGIAGGVILPLIVYTFYRCIAYGMYLWPYADNLAVPLEQERVDRSFIKTIGMVIFGIPVILVVKLIWLIKMFALHAVIPIGVTIVGYLLFKPLGLVLGFAAFCYISTRLYYYYERIQGPPPLKNPQDTLSRKMAELDAEAKRTHGDAHFLSAHALLAKELMVPDFLAEVIAPVLGKMDITAEVSKMDFGDRDVQVEQANGYVRYPGSAHLLTLAPTGAGKGRGTIIPNLLDYDGSVLVIDPKGENAAVTARHRSTLHQVAVLDPWGKSGRPTASFNPLSWIVEENENYIADAASLAEAIVVPGRSGDNHWEDSARDLIKGLILYVALEADEDKRHLLYLREVLSYMPDTMKALFAEMGESDKADGVIRRSGNRFRDMPEKEFGSVLSTAQRHTQFLDDAPGPMRKVLVDTTFDIRDLKSKNRLSLYLCLPPSRLKSHNRWLRVMVNMAIASLEHEQKKPEKPVLFVLDEAAVLGHMQKVAESVGLMRGYGMQLWTIWQDLNQLKAAYKDEWGSFISNAGAIQVFGVNDNETADYFSKHGGEFGYVKSGASAGSGQNIQATGGGLNANEGGSLSIDKKSLISPQDAKNLPSNKLYCFLQGEYPIVCDKLYYDQDPKLADRADENPFL